MKDLTKDSKYYRLTKFIKNQKILFQHTNIHRQMKKIWFDLFNEDISLTQAYSKIHYLKTHGFEFHYEDKPNTILSKHIINNNILFQHRNISYQMKTIWLELFNEELSLKQANHKVRYLKKHGHEFHFEDDSYTILSKHLISNNILFQRGKTRHQIKKIWLELFNEELSLKQASAKIEYLQKRGYEFHFEYDSYSILSKYLISNKILFKYGSTKKQMKKIWFDLFNEQLFLEQARSKNSYLRRHGFEFHFEDDSYTILSKYLINNNVLFKHRNTSHQMKKIWFDLFNEDISLTQASAKINGLKKRGFELHFEDKPNTILSKHIISNNILFQHRNINHQIKKIWLELFNEELSLKQATNKARYLKKHGFEFHFEDDSYTVLSNYLIRNNILFKYTETNKKIKEIWFELFNEQISLGQANSKIACLKKHGFKLQYADNTYEILIKYLTNNTILFQKGNSNKQIKKIWLELFGEELSLKQAKNKIAYLKTLGFVFQFENDYSMIIEHLKKNNIWIKESEEGYIYLQNLCKNLYKEKFSLKKCKLIFLKVSSLCPECVYSKINKNYVQYENIDELPNDKYNEYATIFAEYCRNKDIILSDNFPEDKLSRIWSVCFAKKK